MGIYNLHSYITRNVENDEVSLTQLANEHRKTHRNPTLAVNGKGFAIMGIKKGELEYEFHEIHFADYVNMIKGMVQAFRSLGIGLVFFFSCAEVTNPWLLPNPKAINRQQSRNLSSTFESIKDGSPKKCKYLAPGVIALTRYILKYECGCTVYCALTDVFREMAKYAERNPECFGILATQNYHLVSNDKPLLFPIPFNFERMRTKMFQRSAILKALEMDCCQLRLLACLAGNHVLPQDHLTHFHERISPESRGYDSHLIDKIKRYILREGWTGKDYELPDISKKVGVREELLRNCMSYYDISDNSNQVEDEDRTMSILRQNCADCSIPYSVYATMVSKKFSLYFLMEDPNDNSIRSVSLIYKPVRQRMYYLLFNEEKEVEESFVTNTTGLPEIVRSAKVNIGEDIPSLKCRIEESCETEVRWKLFKACFGLTIPNEQLLLLETHFVLLCSLLNHLLRVKDVNLQEFEVKAFICQALRLDLSSSLEKQEVCFRSVSLAGILWEGVRSLLGVVAVCGFPIPLASAMPWHYFNGRVFYWSYNQLRDASDPDEAVRHLMDRNEELIAKFHRMYNTVIAGTDLETER